MDRLKILTLTHLSILPLLAVVISDVELFFVIYRDLPLLIILSMRLPIVAALFTDVILLLRRVEELQNRRRNS